MRNRFLNRVITTAYITIAAGLLTVAYATETNTTPESLLQHLIDSYVNASKTDQTLKHLLDAKMYLSSAEHDLLVSHDKQSAQLDIENALAYLAEAKDTAQPAAKPQISSLADNLKGLKKKTLERKAAGQENQVDQLLHIVHGNLSRAQESSDASQTTRKRIEEINSQIAELRRHIEHTNLRDDYETVMHSLNAIINSTKTQP